MKPAQRRRSKRLAHNLAPKSVADALHFAATQKTSQTAKIRHKRLPRPTMMQSSARNGQMLLDSHRHKRQNWRRQQNTNAGPSSGDEMNLIKSASRTHLWHWEEQDKSHECILSKDKLEVCFHPQCSESAAAIRASEPLKRNGNYYYWEVTVFDKTYGTSVMFGLCTKQQQLHANDYCNLIGLDKNGWSLSHKGLIWHNGQNAQYTKIFPTNQTVTIGLLFNTMRGELSYYMNGKNLGVAFYGLNNIQEELYPVIGSTAKCTRMRLDGAYCGYVSLMERSCFSLLKNAPTNRLKLIEYLTENRVPKKLIDYLAELAQVCGRQTDIETAQNNNQYNWSVNQTTKSTISCE